MADFSFVTNPAGPHNQRNAPVASQQQQRLSSGNPGAGIRIPSIQDVQAAQRLEAMPDLQAAGRQPERRAPGSQPQPQPQEQRGPPPPSQAVSGAAWGVSGGGQQPPAAASVPGALSHANQVVALNNIIVSRRQEGNPLLKYIRNVRWQYGDIIPDYQLGATACAIFLSLRFHLLKPEYIHHRIKQLQRSFRVRVILCHVDVDDVVECLGQVVKAALLNECTLLCAFSNEECARYLETMKSYETKSADAIQGRTEEDYLSRLNAAMTSVRGVNRTDVLTLGRAFGSVAGTMRAGMDELSRCPGLGPTKVRRLFDTFHEPFRRTLRPVGPGPEQPGAAVTTDAVADIAPSDTEDELDVD